MTATITQTERTELADLQRRFDADETLTRAEEDRHSRLGALVRLQQPKDDLWGHRAIQSQNDRVAQQPAFDFTGDRDEQ